MSDEYIVESLSNFVEHISMPKKEIQEFGCDLFFRGEPEDYGESTATPTLFRDKKLIENETFIYNEAVRINFSEFRNDRTIVESLIKMQHYGYPTRLLDITRNPLVALYFAVNDKNKDKDGFVYLMKHSKKDIRTINDNDVSAICNISNLGNLRVDMVELLWYGIKELISKSKEYNSKYDDIYKRLFNMGIPKSDSSKKLNFELENEMKTLIDNMKDFYSKSKIYNFLFKSPYARIPCKEVLEIQDIYVIDPIQNNSRIIAQAGCFMLFGYGARIANLDKLKESPIIIRGSIKEKILDELDRINVNESTIFPGIDHHAKYIRDRLI